MIYLDYQATTPLAPEVAAAMRPWVEEKFANPHSPSKLGREAAAAIEVARDQVDRSLGLPGGRFAFTSGATEALNWAIKGTFEEKGRRNSIDAGLSAAFEQIHEESMPGDRTRRPPRWDHPVVGDLTTVEHRIWQLLEPYRGELEAATIYGMPSLRWPGAKAPRHCHNPC